MFRSHTFPKGLQAKQGNSEYHFFKPFGMNRGSAMDKHVDSQHKGCQFDSSTCHNKQAIGEEGNGKPPHEYHFPR